MALVFLCRGIFYWPPHTTILFCSIFLDKIVLDTLKSRYHRSTPVGYTMIGSTEKNTIQIVTSNKMVYKPAGATEILPTSTTQVTPLKYISAGANHYYTFDVNTAGYYTFESSYYETSFDTKAYLYKESQTSNGKTLYMYEVAQDDDSGEGINFKIYVYLNPGKYYLRVTGYKQISHGYYYLNYRRG